VNDLNALCAPNPFIILVGNNVAEAFKRLAAGIVRKVRQRFVAAQPTEETTIDPTSSNGGGSGGGGGD
jgi:hypothetical protein